MSIKLEKRYLVRSGKINLSCILNGLALFAVLILVINPSTTQAQGTTNSSTESVQEAEISNENIASANQRVVSLYNAGRGEEALELAETTLTNAISLFGYKDIDTLNSLNNLAFLYEAYGRLSEAEPLYKKALKLKRNLLGPEHPDTLVGQRNLAMLYVNLGSYADAEPLFSGLLEMNQEKLGARHPATISSLNDLGFIYLNTERYHEALPLFEKSLALNLELLGPNHLDSIVSLNNLAFSQLKVGNYDAAEPLYIDLVKISREVLGSEHPDTLVSMNNLAFLYLEVARFRDAERLFEELLHIYRGLYGADHPNTAFILNNLASVYDATGRYAEAEPLLIQALALRRKAFGALHPETLEIQHNLAGLYVAAGFFEKAYPLQKEVLALRKEVLGELHDDTLSSQNNLAYLLETVGRFGEAEQLHLETLALRREHFGLQHPGTLRSLHNLVRLYLSMEQYSDAELLAEEVLSLCQEVLGSRHPDTIRALGNLAYLHGDTAQVAVAEPLYEEAVALYRDVFGQNHPETLMAINNFAWFSERIGEFSTAEALYEEVLQTNLSSLGPRHPNTMISLSNLAVFYDNTGKDARAEQLFREVLALRRDVLGLSNPDTVVSANNLAHFYVSNGDISAAVALLKEGVNSSFERAIYESDRSKGAERRSAALGGSSTSAEFALALAAHAPGPETAALAARVALLRKGLAAERQASLLKLAQHESIKPELADLVSRYLIARADFASAFERIARNPEPDTAAQSALKSILERLDELERQLSVESSEFRALQVDARVDAPDISAALASGTVLVEQVIFRPYDFGTSDGEWGAPHVGAVVLRPGADPAFFDLGPLSPLRSMITALLDDMGAGDAGYFAALDLHAALVAPLEPLIGGADTIYLAPAGPLGLIPFELLLDRHDKPWGTTVSLRLTPTGRSLLRVQDSQSAEGLVAVGAVDYDVAPSNARSFMDASVGDPTLLALAEAAQARAPISAIRSGSLQRFTPLPATAKEIANIALIWRATTHETITPLLAENASEAALDKVRNPRVLHLATHGFVNEGAVEAGMTEGRAALLTGIALAGANRTNTTNSQIDQEREEMSSVGLALGFEIEALDLRGTELVVVSACDTGRGPTDTNEGVYNLARAFGIAGAGAVLVTLKPVDDALTAAFMADFYRAWLTPRSNRSIKPAQALEAVKRNWAQSTDPTKADPRTWAPFMIMHNNNG